MIPHQLLRRYSYFADISEESAKAIAAISEERTAAAGEVLFTEDQFATHLYIVVEGEVDICHRLGNDEQVTADSLGAGDLMAWSAIVGTPRTHASAIARTECRLLAIEADRLKGLLREDPVLKYALMNQVALTIAERLQGARDQLAQTA
jgi:CRP-like cAMP-binding protein